MVVYEFLRLIQFVLGYAGLLSVTAGILVWEACTRTHLSEEIEWSLYTGAFAAISFVNWRSAIKKAEAAECALKEEKRKVSAKRVFAEEPEVLLDRYEMGRPLDARMVSYLDKWIRVSGKFEGTAESLVGDAIHVSVLLKSGRRIPIRFPSESRDRLHVLREGQQLRAVCQVGPGMVLGNAELV